MSPRSRTGSCGCSTGRTRCSRTRARFGAIATVGEAIGDPVCRAWVEQWWDTCAPHLELPDDDTARYRDALLERFATSAHPALARADRRGRLAEAAGADPARAAAGACAGTASGCGRSRARRVGAAPAGVRRAGEGRAGGGAAAAHPWAVGGHGAPGAGGAGPGARRRRGAASRPSRPASRSCDLADRRNADGWLSTGAGARSFRFCVVSRGPVIDTRGDDVARRWSLRLVAGLLAGGAVLSGCSEKQEANDSLPTASASPTEDELPPLGPEDLPMPDEARTQDAAGAEAFVRYYIELDQPHVRRDGRRAPPRIQRRLRRVRPHRRRTPKRTPPPATTTRAATSRSSRSATRSSRDATAELALRVDQAELTRRRRRRAHPSKAESDALRGSSRAALPRVGREPSVLGHDGADVRMSAAQPLAVALASLVGSLLERMLAAGRRARRVRRRVCPDVELRARSSHRRLRRSGCRRRMGRQQRCSARLAVHLSTAYAVRRSTPTLGDDCRPDDDALCPSPPDRIVQSDGDRAAATRSGRWHNGRRLRPRRHSAGHAGRTVALSRSRRASTSRR